MNSQIFGIRLLTIFCNFFFFLVNFSCEFNIFFEYNTILGLWQEIFSFFVNFL